MTTQVHLIPGEGRGEDRGSQKTAKHLIFWGWSPPTCHRVSESQVPLPCRERE